MEKKRDPLSPSNKTGQGVKKKDKRKKEEEKRDPLSPSNKKGQHEKKQDVKKKEDIKQKRLKVFDKNRVGVDSGENIKKKDEKGEKKPFDKKTYRLKKYSHKYKLDQWEEQRKKKLLRDYQKSLKDDPMAGSYKPVSFDDDTNCEVGKFVRHPDIIEKDNLSKSQENKNVKNWYVKAKEHLNKAEVERLKKQEEVKKALQEKEQKMQEYSKKKQERFIKLSQKTKKGQPVMKGRLELLLEKIQKG